MPDHLSLLFFEDVLLDHPDGVLGDQGPNSRSAERVRITSVLDRVVPRILDGRGLRDR